MPAARALVALLASLAMLPAAPAAFADTLVDQTTPSGTGSAVSEEGASPADYNGEVADDIVVPDGAQWTVAGVQVRGINYGGRAAQPVIVRFYTDSGGLPGAETYKQTSTISTVDPNFAITLATPAVLGPGTHWLSAQVAGSDGTAASEWFWLNRGALSGSPAAFRNGFDPELRDVGRAEHMPGRRRRRPAVCADGDKRPGGRAAARRRRFHRRGAGHPACHALGSRPGDRPCGHVRQACERRPPPSTA